MPVTKRAQDFIKELYRSFGLDQSLELLRLAEDDARKRQGHRVTLRDIRHALREVQAEQRQWPDEAICI